MTVIKIHASVFLDTPFPYTAKLLTREQVVSNIRDVLKSEKRLCRLIYGLIKYWYKSNNKGHTDRSGYYITVPLNGHIYVIDLNDAIKNISDNLALVLRTYLTYLARNFACSRGAAGKHTPGYSNIYGAIAGIPLKRILKNRTGKVKIDRHLVKANGFLLSKSLYSGAIYIEETVRAVKSLVEYRKGEIGCDKKIIDSITRGFTAGKEKQLLLVKGRIRIEHPEHPTRILHFEKPTLIRLTLLNSLTPHSL